MFGIGRSRRDEIDDFVGGDVGGRSMSGGRGAFLAGLLLGAVAGGAIALLCSPRAGKENRAAMMEKLPALREEAPGLFESVTDQIRERIDAGRDAYRQASSETRQRMQRELDASQGGPPAAP
jgi:gas vesicle protein